MADSIILSLLLLLLLLDGREHAIPNHCFVSFLLSPEQRRRRQCVCVQKADVDRGMVVPMVRTAMIIPFDGGGDAAMHSAATNKVMFIIKMQK